LPVGLITAIVSFRVKQNESKQAKKKWYGDGKKFQSYAVVSYNKFT
jgi:hypothetical protein